MALVSVGLSPQPALAAKPDSCPANKPLVVDVSDTARNVADYGADGHVWALDDFTETIQIWRVGANAFCMQRHDVGSFTSFAGPSPEGTGVVPAGVTGSFEGTIVANLYGTFKPTLPTSGYLGQFDGMCDQNGNCPGPDLELQPNYFSRFYTFRFLVFHGHFDARACGIWDQQLNGDTGDIVC